MAGYFKWFTRSTINDQTRRLQLLVGCKMWSDQVNHPTAQARLEWRETLRASEHIWLTATVAVFTNRSKSLKSQIHTKLSWVPKASLTRL